MVEWGGPGCFKHTNVEAICRNLKRDGEVLGMLPEKKINLIEQLHKARQQVSNIEAEIRDVYRKIGKAYSEFHKLKSNAYNRGHFSYTIDLWYEDPTENKDYPWEKIGVIHIPEWAIEDPDKYIDQINNGEIKLDLKEW